MARGMRRRRFRSRRRFRRNRRGRGSRQRRSFRRGSALRSKVGRARPISLTMTRMRPFPDRLRTKMTFCTGPVLYSASANYFAAFTGNGLFNPSLGAGSGQPIFFTQLMGLYTNFVVSASRIKIRLTSNGVSALPANGRAICIPQISTALSTQGYTLEEQPLAQCFEFNSNYSGTIQRKYYCPTKVMIREFSMTEPTCYGDNANDPAAIWYWGIYVESLDDSSSLALAIEVKIEYDAEFFGLLFTT